MLSLDKNKQAFITLIQAGLWQKKVSLASYGDVNYEEIYRQAQEQSVVGLVTAGLENVKDVKVSQSIALAMAGEVLQLEQRNRAMNAFIGKLIQRLRNEDIYTLLVKGQGIAQCYERPLWRACGDVDLYLSEYNYEKAKKYLLPVAYNVENEDKKRLHLGMTIDGWMVELHGTLRLNLTKRIDRGIDEVHNDVFFNGNVRSWMCGDTQVFLPGVDNDVIFVFTHILQHFFGEGIGLRQLCDWSRLLWSYRESLNCGLLKSRIKKMRMYNEWRAFAALAVKYLGMPAEAMPLYDPSVKWRKKADRIMSLIMESGNFGHAVDKSYKYKYPKLIRAFVAFWRHSIVASRRFVIFPHKSFIGWINQIRLGILANI